MNVQSLSYRFKVKNADVKTINFFNSACSEYKCYYNRVSSIIHEICKTKTIGEIADNINEKRKNTTFITDSGEEKLTYYGIAISDKWYNEPAYKLFLKKYDNSQAARNLIVSYIMDNNLDDYHGNMFGISQSYYRTSGYLKDCVAKYFTMVESNIKSCKFDIKKSDICSSSTDEDLLNQLLYELQKSSCSSLKDFKEHISYLKTKDYSDVFYERMNILFSFYKNNTDLVNDVIEKKALEKLFDSESVNMVKNTATLTFKQTSFSGSVRFDINEKRDGLLFYWNNCIYELYGRRDVIKNGELLVNFNDIQKVGNSIIIQCNKNSKGKDELWFIFTVDTELTEEKCDFNKGIGVDVNTKHALLSLSSCCERVKLTGFVNFYDRFVKDADLMSMLNSEERENFKNNANSILFAPIEYEYLMSRIFNKEERLKKIEDRIVSIMKSMAKEYPKNDKSSQYICDALKLRVHIKTYLYKEMVYRNAQKQYDIDMGFTGYDDERRKLYPFSKSEIGEKLYLEKKFFANKIIACRNSIIHYIYAMLKDNGFDYVNLENLSSSSFSKSKITFPTIKSLCNKIDFETVKYEEFTKDELYNKFSSYYNFEIDENGFVANITYTKKAQDVLDGNFVRDKIIKGVNFASIKDEFLHMKNHNTLNVIFVPSEFSSQIDSIDHALFVESIDVKNIKLVDKKKIRPKQERHINGLNADENASRNIHYYTHNTVWRDSFMLENIKHKYNEPFMKPRFKSKMSMINEMKKLGALKTLEVHV